MVNNSHLRGRGFKSGGAQNDTIATAAKNLTKIREKEERN